MALTFKPAVTRDLVQNALKAGSFKASEPRDSVKTHIVDVFMEQEIEFGHLADEEGNVVGFSWADFSSDTDEDDKGRAAIHAIDMMIAKNKPENVAGPGIKDLAKIINQTANKTAWHCEAKLIKDKTTDKVTMILVNTTVQERLRDERIEAQRQAAEDKAKAARAAK